jgi:hypothetical protein
LGFLRLALEHDAEIVFVAAVGNDELYFQAKLPTPDAIVRLADGGDGKRYRGSYLLTEIRLRTPGPAASVGPRRYLTTILQNIIRSQADGIVAR